MRAYFVASYSLANQSHKMWYLSDVFNLLWRVLIIHGHTNSSEFKSAKKSAREVFGHSQSLEILVILNPAGYMLASSAVAFIHLRWYILLWIPLKRL